LCERLSAQEALSIGLLDYVAAPGQALVKAREVAQQVLALPQTAVRMSKETINAHANALNHASSHMAHDQIALAAADAASTSARTKALKR
jgi:enoyl-CoA hydratase